MLICIKEVYLQNYYGITGKRSSCLLHITDYEKYCSLLRYSDTDAPYECL